MLPPIRDFDDILKGNDWSRQLRFWAGSGDSLAPLDLTGSEVVFFVGVFGNVFRKSSNDEDSGLVILDPAGGKIEITFKHGETRDMTTGRTKYEIERRLDLGGGETWHETLQMGEIVVTEWVNDDG